MTAAIVVDGLIKRFGNTPALAGMDLVVPAGTVLGLLGPNGAGKTTAVRVLATLLHPDAGTATVCGFDVVHGAYQVRSRIGLTGQNVAVDPSLTGVENLLLIGRLLGLSRSRARSRAGALLRQFGLAEAAGRRVKTYSGGMCRRLDLAASMVGQPEVLFLDEPTTGLDPRSRTDLWKIIRELAGGGVTVVLTTQYLEEADRIADRIAVVDHGRVVASGTPGELKAKIGAHALEVRPVDLTRLPVVAATIGQVTGTAPQAGEDSVTARVNDAAVLPAVVRGLDAASVQVAGLVLREPSLDEVYLALTGHRNEMPAVVNGAMT